MDMASLPMGEAKVSSRHRAAVASTTKLPHNSIASCETPISISFANGIHERSPFLPMRLSWPQHLQAARTIELSGDQHRGTSLALMGLSLLLLAEDLLELECDAAGPSNGPR
jgi:hypothetical protein